MPDSEQEQASFARSMGWKPNPDDEVEGGPVLAVEIDNTPYNLRLGLTDKAKYVSCVKCE